MKYFLDFLLWVLLGITVWATFAYGVAWWRTRQRSFGMVGITYALMTVVVIVDMNIINSGSRTPPLVFLAIASNFIITRVASDVRRLYTGPWDVLLFRHPRHGD